MRYLRDFDSEEVKSSAAWNLDPGCGQQFVKGKRNNRSYTGLSSSEEARPGSSRIGQQPYHSPCSFSGIEMTRL